MSDSHKERGNIIKITILVDNNTLIDQYFLAEPGLSIYIEDGDKNILFDCGYSGIFMENALKMHIDLLNLDYLVLSHSHLDHTWGLTYLIKTYTEAHFLHWKVKKPQLITHPRTFMSTRDDQIGEIGSLIPPERLTPYLYPHLTKEPFSLTERLVYLGEIPRVMPFEPVQTIGRKTGEDEGDAILDDSALAYRSDGGLVIITGCSHAGICNIIEHAKDVCRDDRIVDVIGGLHLLFPTEHRLAGTLAYLKEQRLSSLHACHCTDLSSKIALAEVAPIKEVGVGLSLSYT